MIITGIIVAMIVLTSISIIRQSKKLEKEHQERMKKYDDDIKLFRTKGAELESKYNKYQEKVEKGFDDGIYSGRSKVG